MISIEALQQKSASRNELVLPLALALDALKSFKAAGIVVLGWEGWLRYPDGRLGHSARHQGTSGSGWEYETLEQTMRQAQTEHLTEPEAPHSELLFCIAPGA